MVCLPGMIGEKITNSLPEKLNVKVCIYNMWGIMVGTSSVPKYILIKQWNFCISAESKRDFL